MEEEDDASHIQSRGALHNWGTVSYPGIERPQIMPYKAAPETGARV